VAVQPEFTIDPSEVKLNVRDVPDELTTPGPVVPA
jgi:hypothetical protein